MDQNSLIIATCITVTFLLFKYIDTKFIQKEELEIKQLIRDLILVYLGSISGLFIIITLYTIQLFFGIFSLSHPDNAFQVNELVTPLHIVPEWYFLSYYTMLKAIPNKNAGFIILLTSILILLLFGESHRRRNSNFCISCFFLIIICFLWIGAQLPQEIFISYGRILTLFYYFIIIYLLFVLF